MTRRIHHSLLLTCLLLAIFPILRSALFSAPEKEAEEPGRKNLQKELTEEELRWINEARSLILESYVDRVDDEDLVYAALEGMVSSLDSYCTFYSPEEEQRYHEDTKGEYVGIGLKLDPYSNAARVLFPFPFSPAEKAGLRPGDLIIEIDGCSLVGSTRSEAEDLLRGPAGSVCSLVFQPRDAAADSDHREISIKRKKVAEQTVFNARLADEKLGIAYMRLKNFNNGTPGEVTRAVRRLKKKGVRSLILDLRFNKGGLLKSALHTANLFQGDGVLLRTRGRSADSNRLFTASKERHLFPRITLVILVNRYTASAAEVLAGTLQDHARAVLVGERTFGKGVVQSAFSKDFGGQVIIKLTTARYYTPLGRCIERNPRQVAAGGNGLEPDFTRTLSRRESDSLKRFLRRREVPDAYIEAALGKDAERLCSDPQYVAAVELLEGKKVFSPLGQKK